MYWGAPEYYVRVLRVRYQSWDAFDNRNSYLLFSTVRNLSTIALVPPPCGPLGGDDVSICKTTDLGN